MFFFIIKFDILEQKKKIEKKKDQKIIFVYVCTPQLTPHPPPKKQNTRFPTNEVSHIPTLPTPTPLGLEYRYKTRPLKRRIHSATEGLIGCVVCGALA